MDNPWDTTDISEFLEEFWLHDNSSNLPKMAWDVKEALIIAVRALSLQEEYREEALDKVRERLGLTV